jgi:UDP-N-acetylmuramate--alanine ligase
MNNLENIKNVYFLGVGGIGMSALARYFKHIGMNVAGYDRTPTELTHKMESEGIRIHFEDDIRLIPSSWHPHETLAIFTPALPDDHQELTWFRGRSIPLLKRAKVLGLICNEKNCIAVSGTHGKTTISTITSNILNQTEQGCGAFLGGVSKNFGSNLLLPKDESPWIVAEADEYDRSFLQLNPYLAIVTSVDADHLDIYGEKEKILESFGKFVSQIKPGGKLVVKKGIDFKPHLYTNKEIFTYSIYEEADFCVHNLKLNMDGPSYSFDIKTPSGFIKNCKMSYPGLLNVENAVAAASLAYLAETSFQHIRAGIESYLGVERRFDIRFKDAKYLYIDDYAHHPEELKAIISSVKALYPNRHITGFFQPHLFTRTKDFAPEFAESLDLLDRAAILPVYPARELPIPGISSKTIFNLMKITDKQLVEKSEMTQLIENMPVDIVMTMGAGDIDGMAPYIIEALKTKT